MSGTPRRASVVGAGLIGGSIGLALRARGWNVTGTDKDEAAVRAGLARGAFDSAGLDPAAEVVFVATPVGAVVDEAARVLGACRSAVVTDVGSVKAAVAAAVADPRFVPGHPMAGSEQLGMAGADAALFEGAAWVLTPSASTADASYALVRSVVSDLGAEVLTMDADQHDSLVAVVSHVPHLTAAALVGIARERAEDERAVLRLAAGGFRDMTRIAAGSPAIWPDICADNRTAIVASLDRLLEGLGALRALVAGGDRDGLLDVLGQAQASRRALPIRSSEPTEVSEVRVAVADRPGEIAAVATLATGLGVNLLSLETVDAAERPGGTLHLRVARTDAERLAEALRSRGHAAVVSTEAPDGAT